ncbi:MAG TPA: Ig-like domain-containing protein, partial [Rhodocyclaceae bacterium]|nr:Ig-like domain-containing protein [Rhodocyclaceae bacterium]
MKVIESNGKRTGGLQYASELARIEREGGELKVALAPKERLHVDNIIDTARSGDDLVLWLDNDPGVPPARVVVVGFFASQTQSRVEIAEAGHAEGVAPVVHILTAESPVAERPMDEMPATARTQTSAFLISGTQVTDLPQMDGVLQLFGPKDGTHDLHVDLVAADNQKMGDTLVEIHHRVEQPTQISVNSPVAAMVILPNAPTIQLPAAHGTLDGTSFLNRAQVVSDGPFTGTSDPYVKIQLTMTDGSGHSVTATGSADAGGHWSISLGADALLALPDGPVTLKAFATNMLNQSGPVAVGPQLELHMVNPPAPSGVALAMASDSGVQGDGLTNNATPDFHGTLSSDVTQVLVWADSNGDGKLDAGEQQVGNVVVNGVGIFDWAPTSALADGAHHYLFQSMDKWGNVSEVLLPAHVTIDTQLTPALTLDTVAGNDAINYQEAHAGAIIMSGVAEVGATVDITISQNGGSHTYHAVANPLGVWQTTFDAVHDTLD